jgi:hypothetical protein
MKTILIAATLLLLVTTAFGMVGGPIFPLGSQMTAMTVEASRTTLETTSPSGSGSQTGISDRVLLTARYGVLPNTDVSATLGTSNLGFSQLYGGFSDFKSSWSVAWGAGVRTGYPVGSTPYQIVGILQYVGFRPKGSLTNGTQMISSKYLWHEITPSLAVGGKFGPLVPYIGASKPYLFGSRDINVTMRGREFSSAGGLTTYSDGQQPLRGILGLEWRLPEGYSLTAEGTATTGGVWTLSLGVAQVLK